MKRSVSWLMALVLCLSSLGMEGCSASKKATISVGQWLALVNKEFGMESYSIEEPFFENITAENPYFAAVQTAAEWDVIDTEQEMQVDENLTWEQALVTLVNVGNFVVPEASQEEKVQYAVDHFDKSIRSYWMKRDIEVSKAVYLLGVAQEQWANFKYDHVIEKATYKSDVVDLTSEDGKINDYLVQDNTIAIPLSHGVDIKAGDVYVLPANEQNLEVTAHKAESVYTDEQYLYIVNDDDHIELEEVAEEIFVEGSYAPTMEQIVVYDGNGNLLSMGEQAINAVKVSDKSETYVAEKLGDHHNSENYIAENCGVGNKVKSTFEVGEWKVLLEYTANGKVNLKATVETPNLLNKDKTDWKLKGTFSAGLKDLEITNKVDFKWMQLNEALLKVDYETEFSGGLKLERKLMEKVAAPGYSNGNGKFLTNLKRSVWKDKGSAGAQTIASKKVIKICSLNIYSVGVAKVCLDVSLVVGVDGSVSIKVTESGTKGLEYKNNNLRLINTSDKNVDAEMKAKIEATIGVGPALYVVGLKKKVIGVEVQFGAGAEATVTLHLADAEGHLIEETGPENEALPEIYDALYNVGVKADAQEIVKIAEAQGCTYTVESSQIDLHIDTCIDVKGYFILRIGLSDEAYATQLLGKKVTTSWEILGSKNAVFAHWHIDNFQFANSKFVLGKGSGADLCTFNFKPFEDKEEEETEEAVEVEESVEIEDTVETEGVDADNWGYGMIGISDMKLHIPVGEQKALLVEYVPTGYEINDVIFSSENSKIATVDARGVVSGIAEGNTMISVSTKDGKYVIFCAVSVSEEEKTEFEALDVNVGILSNVSHDA